MIQDLSPLNHYLEIKFLRSRNKFYKKKMSGNQTFSFVIEHGKAVSAIGIFLWITISNIVAVSLLLWSIKRSSKMTVPKILTLTLAIVDLIFGGKAFLIIYFCICNLISVSNFLQCFEIVI